MADRKVLYLSFVVTRVYAGTQGDASNIFDIRLRMKCVYHSNHLEKHLWSFFLGNNLKCNPAIDSIFRAKTWEICDMT